MKKYIFITIEFIVICSILVLGIKLFFREQVKTVVKYCVCSKVARKEDELAEVIDELDNDEIAGTIHRYKDIEGAISYKELNKQKISKIFKTFDLMVIENKLNENEMAVFAIYPYVDILVSGKSDVYSYGFYFSAADVSLDIVTGEKCDLEFEYDGGLGEHRWYKTERITDNWWYYEEIFSFREIRLKGGY